MDVRCDRCDTEYDFDDALVSERGTTVRCTNCGHQFKVYPAQRASGGAEYWVVRTRTGQEYTFTTLRDLQSGLAEGRIGPDDELERGARPPRPLRSIAELEPFFPSKRPTGGRNPSTLSGVAPPAGGPAGDTLGSPRPDARTPSAPAPRRERKGTLKGAQPEPPPGRDQLDRTLPSKGSEPPAARRPKGVSGKIVAPRPISSRPPPAASDAAAARQPKPGRALAPTLRSEVGPGPKPEPDAFDRARALAPIASSAPPPSSEEPSDSVKTPRRPPPLEAFGELDSSPTASPPSAEPARQLPPVAPIAAAAEPELPPPAPSEPMAAPEPSERFFTGAMAAVESREPPSQPYSRYLMSASRRAAGSRWIVGLVVVGALALLGITAGRRFLARAHRLPSQPSTPASAGGRAQELVRAGLRQLEQGELDGAREQLAQARLLAAGDASVLGALARLETARADLVWLRLALLDPGDDDSMRLARRQLDAALERAGVAVDEALRVAPRDPSVVRARVDWLRLKGDLGQARASLGPLSAQPSDPANAYVLGALDLAEPAPIWSSVLDRLRNAARADQGLGIASATFVYALVRAGRWEEAQSQLQSLATSPRPHQLLPELQTFVRRASEQDAGAVAETMTLDAEVAPPAEKTAGRAGAADYRDQLARARSALGHGRLAEADELYRAVLAKDATNTEALTGLADVARARNDPRSTELYDQALAKNPSYLPALMARADLKWSSGDRPGAAVLYRRIVEQAGPGSEYGQRAAARLAQSVQAGGATTGVPASSRAPTSSPEIDTTDLPGLK